MTMLRRIDPWVVLVVVCVSTTYLAIVPRVLSRLDPMTGDEPFYVMTAISIVRDHDLDESNNYAQRDYDDFYPSAPLPDDWRGWTRLVPTLEPHAAISSRAGAYTKHGLGLPLLIALPFEWFGRAGAMSVVAACAVGLAVQMYLLARQLTALSWLAAVIAIGMAVTMPITPYALLLFPEIPATLLLIYALRRIASTDNTLAQLLATGSAIGFLPWLHQRFALTSVVLSVLLVMKVWRTHHLRRLIVTLAPVAIGGASLLIYNVWLYGAIVQPAENHDGFSGLSGTLNGAFGLLLDAQWGLWIAAPITVLALAALPWWYQSDRSAFVMTALAVVPYLGILATYRVWWGSWGPAARYLVPVVPLLAGPLAAWLDRATAVGRIVAALLWSAGAGLTLIGIADPQRFYHQPDGHNQLVSRAGEILHLDIARHLVAYQTLARSPVEQRVLAGVIGLSLALIAVACIWLLPRYQTARAAKEASTV